MQTTTDGRSGSYFPGCIYTVTEPFVFTYRDLLVNTSLTGDCSGVSVSRIPPVL